MDKFIDFFLSLKIIIVVVSESGNKIKKCRSPLITSSLGRLLDISKSGFSFLFLLSSILFFIALFFYLFFFLISLSLSLSLFPGAADDFDLQVQKPFFPSSLYFT